MTDDAKPQWRCAGCNQLRDRDGFRRNTYCGACNANQPPDCTCPSTFRDCRCGAQRSSR